MEKKQETFPFHKKSNYPITFQSIQVVKEIKPEANSNIEVSDLVSNFNGDNADFKLKLYKSICNINLK